MKKRCQVILGEFYRWYLTRAHHPLKGRVARHSWNFISKRRIWTRYDNSLVISLNVRDYIQHTIFLAGYYEPELIRWLKSELTSKDVFWDIGANIGAMSLIAAKSCGQVVAFEPDPRMFTLLEDHVAANKLNNVRVYSVALSNQNGSAELFRAPDTNTGMTSLHPRDSTWSRLAVQTWTADDVVMSDPTLFPSVIKMDVEGAERMVLQGAKRILESVTLRKVIFESKEGRDGLPNDQEICTLFTKSGFQIRPFGSSDPAVQDGMNNYLATRHSPGF
jgi:FkbM family methyltransferase